MTRPQQGRSGITLTEILIGIMVLGIGVISLATLFPIGLLRMKRAVNDVRGTVIAQSAWNEVRIRNLLAPPFGALPTVADPTFVPSPPRTVPSPAHWTPFSAVDPSLVQFDVNVTPQYVPLKPTAGPGLPVIIDPLWVNQNSATPFGMVDLDNNGQVDVLGGEGIPRITGGILSLDLASELFSSADDIIYGDNEKRIIPSQDVIGGSAPFLSPTYGVPFGPTSIARERRYTWMILARKVNASQVHYLGADGALGVPQASPDDILDNWGADLIPNTIDDPAHNMALAPIPVPAPIGPFDITIVAFYTRDFAVPEPTYANVTATVPLFTYLSEIAVLEKRNDVALPEIPIGAYVMDTTFDSSTIAGLRNGYVYRVVGKTVDAATGNLILTLDQKARSDGSVITWLRGAVGVFQKQVP